MSKQRRYSAEFKLDAVSRMEHCKTITGLAKELGIPAEVFIPVARSVTCRRQSCVGATQRSPPGSQSEAVSQPTPTAAESRIAELERLLGRKQLEFWGYPAAGRVRE
jgi:transposase-like protein